MPPFASDHSPRAHVRARHVLLPRIRSPHVRRSRPQAFPYESSRKRMSVIARLPPDLLAACGGGCPVRLYCKGADNVLLVRPRNIRIHAKDAPTATTSNTRGRPI